MAVSGSAAFTFSSRQILANARALRARAGSKRLRERSPRDVSFGPDDVDAVDGHIISMPLLLKRTCFGCPVTRLRHGQNWYTRKNGDERALKCGACPVKDACRKVVDQRLSATPDIAAAYTSWLDAGEPFEKDGPWWALVDALIAHGPFFNSNAAAEVAHREAAPERKRARERKRPKRVRPSKAKSKRKYDPAAVKEILAERDRLEERYLNDAENGHVPRWRATPEQCRQAASVWAAARINEVCGHEVTEGSVVNVMRAYGIIWDDIPSNLRKRVQRLLASMGAHVVHRVIWNVPNPFEAERTADDADIALSDADNQLASEADTDIEATFDAILEEGRKIEQFIRDNPGAVTLLKVRKPLGAQPTQSEASRRRAEAIGIAVRERKRRNAAAMKDQRRAIREAVAETGD